jgi:hypothetical protein
MQKHHCFVNPIVGLKATIAAKYTSLVDNLAKTLCAPDSLREMMYIVYVCSELWMLKYVVMTSEQVQTVKRKFEYVLTTIVKSNVFVNEFTRLCAKKIVKLAKYKVTCHHTTATATMTDPYPHIIQLYYDISDQIEAFMHSEMNAFVAVLDAR